MLRIPKYTTQFIRFLSIVRICAEYGVKSSSVSYGAPQALSIDAAAPVTYMASPAVFFS